VQVQQQRKSVGKMNARVRNVSSKLCVLCGGVKAQNV
jgi:hypothetical protein